MRINAHRLGRTLALALALTALAGCASEAEIAALKRDAARPIVCSDTQDCARKWNRALAWIEDNSVLSIAIANDRVIETKDPGKDSSDTAYQATMFRNSDGSGTISFEAWCTYFLGCLPSRLGSEADFADYIMGPPGK